MSREAEEPSAEELARRVRGFEHYWDFLETRGVHLPERDEPYPCPCCGYLTLGSRGNYEICDVCFWEDDGHDDHNDGRLFGGPNGGVTLAAARRNFETFGACDERSIYRVRPPEPAEIPADGSGRPIPPEAREKRRRKLP
jgi:Cysteine-rich CPCC